VGGDDEERRLKSGVSRGNRPTCVICPFEILNFEVVISSPTALLESGS
jgi:hypothetical protein